MERLCTHTHTRESRLSWLARLLIHILADNSTVGEYFVEAAAALQRGLHVPRLVALLPEAAGPPLASPSPSPSPSLSLPTAPLFTFPYVSVPTGGIRVNVRVSEAMHIGSHLADLQKKEKE